MTTNLLNAFPDVKEALEKNSNDVNIIDNFKIVFKIVDGMVEKDHLYLNGTIYDKNNESVTSRNVKVTRDLEQFEENVVSIKEKLCSELLEEFPEKLLWAADNIEHCGKTGILPEEQSKEEAELFRNTAKIVQEKVKEFPNDKAERKHDEELKTTEVFSVDPENRDDVERNATEVFSVDPENF